ncbi:MAG TPA: ABC transporter permease [Allosphingosinicella sp.]|jgi:putative ABC transport system permease protein|nr:ABC transporter permease [Allosphingosinicella sp.]
MWRNYLTVGLRALARSKTYAFINVFGLALGLAACLLLIVFVRYEISYDEWLPGAERVYQVQSISTDPDETESPLDQYVHGVMTETLAQGFPQIEAIARIDEIAPVFLRDGEATAAPMHVADANFFDIVRLPFLRGDAATALSGTDSLVLTRREATNRFGGIDVMGQTVTAVRRGEQYSLRVTGVIEDLPRNSHMDFGLIGRLPEAAREECGWGCVNSFVYLRLRPGADPREIERQLPAWERRAIPPMEVGSQQRSEGDRYDWRLVAMRDVHLSGAPGASARPGNDRTSLATFSIVALLILGMATVNFVNLATARASQRAREVALRKVLGATRGQLIVQFLAESAIVTGIAVVLAVALAELATPWLGAMLDAGLHTHWLGERGLVFPVFALWAVVAVAGGIYPAFYLSRYRPAEVLKANKSSAEPIGTGRIRMILVVGQFAVSIALIVCTLIVYRQTMFVQTSDLGFRRDGIVQVANLNRAAIIPQTETLMREVARLGGVQSVAGSNLRVAADQVLTNNVEVPGRAGAEIIGSYSVSPEYFETMGLRLLAGRALSRQFANDDVSVPFEPEEAAAAAERAVVARGANVVVNEAAARRFGFNDPQGAVGRQVRMAMFGPDMPLVPATIVGVVANGRFRSAREPVEPHLFFDRRVYNNLVIRYDAADPERIRQAVGEIWRRLAPEVPYEAEYADQQLARLYAADAARARTFGGFALLAVIIACLGLFGLAAFTAERRTKEIGIRKVFGARSRDIVGLLAWQFAKPVIIANIIAWPLAWYVMDRWLQGFDARISASQPWPFLLAGGLALLIALGTISAHALKVSRTNPIKALRYE